MRIERVVIGMDFSDAAIAAATWTAETFAPEAQLIFAHALEPDSDRFLPQATYATSLEASLPRLSPVWRKDCAKPVCLNNPATENRPSRAARKIANLLL